MTVAERVRAIVDAVGRGNSVTLSTDTLAAWLLDEPDHRAGPELVQAPEAPWREKLWTVPAETRLGVGDLADALDREPSWVYKRSSAKAAAANGKHGELAMLPAHRLGGQLSFKAGEVREWLTRQEIRSSKNGRTRP